MFGHRFTILLNLFCLGAALPPVSNAHSLRLIETNLTIKQVDLSAAAYRDKQGYPKLDPAKLLTAPRQTVERSHRAVILENDYLKVVVLPEMGRVYSLYSKLTSHEELWVNPIAQPLTGQQNDLGWWMVWGGIEYTLPRGEHGTTWALPWSFQIVENSSSRKAVRMTVLEPATRLQEQLELALIPKRAACETSIVITNTSARAARFSHWMNAMCAPGGRGEVTPNTEIIVPCQAMIVADRPFNRWMLGDRIQEFERNPLRWVKHWRSPGDLLATNLTAGFYGAFSHDANEGLVRVFDPKITPGMDIWTWGYPPAPPMQHEYSLLPNLGYVELWGGTSEDFSDEARRVLPPHGSMAWHEWIYPFSGTKGLTFANPEWAIAFTQDLETGDWHLGIFPTAGAELDCVVSLKDRTILKKKFDVRPGELLDVTDRLPAKQRSELLSLTLNAPAGLLKLTAKPINAPRWGSPYLSE